jgi:hypothetical protein
MIKYIDFGGKDDEDRANLAVLSSSTDSATELAKICSIIEIFMCRYSRTMKSSNPPLAPASTFLSACSRCVFENNVRIFFLRGLPGNYISEESHAPGRSLRHFWYRKCVCIEEIFYDPKFATF